MGLTLLYRCGIIPTVPNRTSHKTERGYKMDTVKERYEARETMQDGKKVWYIYDTETRGPSENRRHKPYYKTEKEARLGILLADLTNIP